MAARSRTLRFKVLFVFALSLVVVWSVLWFVAATIVERQVDRALMAANGNGSVVDCAHRAVTGFPFRIELRCGEGTKAEADAMHATISGLTVAALIYRPDRLIAEVRGPAMLDTAELPPITADWDLAHASVRLDLGAAKLSRVDAEVVKTNVTLGGIDMDVAELDVNLREDPVDPASLNFAVRVDGLNSEMLAAPVSLEALGTVKDGASLLAGRTAEVLAAVLLSGAPVVFDTLTLEHGEMAVAANGQLRLDGEGLLSGQMMLALVGEEMAARYVAALLPAAQRETVSTLVTSLLKNTPQSGEVGGRAAKEVVLNFDGGKVRVGSFPFPLPFQIPPVRVAAR